jgi:uncharacterized protein YegP (UPF0339 family)
MSSNLYRFELFKAHNGQWSWHMKAPNNLKFAYAGETYHNKVDANHGIELVKAHAAQETGGCRFEVFQTTNGQWAWRFKAANSRIVAWSGESYYNRNDALHGVQLVKQWAVVSPVFELTCA